MVPFEHSVDYIFATTCQLTLIRCLLNICQLFILMILQHTFFLL